jgi:hypothetical protein
MGIGVRAVLGISGVLLTSWAVGCGDSTSSPSEPSDGPGSSGSGGEPACEFDADKDGHCSAPLQEGDDCDDRDPDVYPGAPEAVNAVDDDCDQVIDEGVTAACPLTSEMPAAGCETATQLLAGASHACVLTDAGRVLCWGSNDSGVLGLPDLANSPVPLAVPGVQGATALAVTGAANCALVGGNAICWGAGSAYPFNVRLPPNTIQIAIAFTTTQGGVVHYSVYALDSDGAFYRRGLLAELNATSNPVGTEFVQAGTDVKQLVGGGGPMCAIGNDDTLRCFKADPPTQIAATAVDFAVMGVDGKLCYKTGGELYCGGSTAPGTKVAGNGSAIGAATSSSFKCAFDAAGTVGCWSGAGPTTIADATALALGETFGCVLRTSGKISCFGNDDGGRLGDGRTKPSIQEMEPVDAVAAPTIELQPVVLLGGSPLGACDSLTDVSTLVTRSPQIHAAVGACKTRCAAASDSDTCFAECANVPGISPACFGCYTALATCRDDDCYQAFVACAGYPVDFVQAANNAPRFGCLGAECLRGVSVGEPCTTGDDCLSGSCSKLPQTGDVPVCVATSGAFCLKDSPYCVCTTGIYATGRGPTNFGHCGGCSSEGRSAGSDGICYRLCTEESFCVEGQECRNFANNVRERYCR